MLLKSINGALRKYIASDPEIASKLDPLEGQKLCVRLTDINREFVVSPGPSGITVREAEESEVQQEYAAILHSSIFSLIRAGLGASYQTMLNNGSLKIQGDVEFANQLHAILKEIDVDWEEVASKYVGDPVAYRLGLSVSKCKSYLARSANHLSLDVSEYLQEESRMVPTKVEINRFMNDVDSLEARVQRLEARVCRLTEWLGS